MWLSGQGVFQAAVTAGAKALGQLCAQHLEEQLGGSCGWSRVCEGERGERGVQGLKGSREHLGFYPEEWEPWRAVG